MVPALTRLFIVKKTIPTWTSLTLAALVRADDFRTAAQLRVEIGASSTQLSAALIHLRRRKAVDFVEAGDALWWFATPETDDRSCKRDERTPESRPRRPRKPRRQK